MVNQQKILAGLVITTLVTLACSITVPEVTSNQLPVQTLTVNEPLLNGGQPGSLFLRTGFGKINLDGSTTAWVGGEIQYNRNEWKPVIQREADRLTIRQDIRSTSTDGEITNIWNLHLGQQVMNLEIETGAADTRLELGGIPLTNLTINQGASSSRITFEKPNPQIMDRFVFRTGASKMDMIGLANAGFGEMILDAGAGSYDLDFSGKMQRSAAVRITCGAGDITIRIPEGTAAEVTINSGMANISPSGTWTISGRTYSKAGQGAKLSISLDMGIGNIKLVSR